MPAISGSLSISVRYFLPHVATSPIKTHSQTQKQPRKPLSTSRIKYHKFLNSLLGWIWRRAPPTFAQNGLALIFHVIPTASVFHWVCGNIIIEEGPPQVGVVTAER